MLTSGYYIYFLSYLDSDSDKSLAVGGKDPANVRTRIQRFISQTLHISCRITFRSFTFVSQFSTLHQFYCRITTFTIVNPISCRKERLLVVLCKIKKRSRGAAIKIEIILLGSGENFPALQTIVCLPPWFIAFWYYPGHSERLCRAERTDGRHPRACASRNVERCDILSV